ncbi:protein MB21D2-like [Dendronephthya gigantea]|uniref:protein MB21D2-like n=1 Tax=Dendronephthya gigantea TaxID=151771 RepID=UPI00106D9CDB|nr:protein MB21D2-like [Dendronephthya gigantea]
MAQADPSIVANLQEAILKICNYPRGCRRISDFFGKFTITPELKEGNEVIRILGDLIDQHVLSSAKKYFDDEGPFQLDDILISGSVSEGTVKINLMTQICSDTDFFLVLKNIKVTEKDQKEGCLTMREHTPFVNLYLNEADLIQRWIDFVEISEQTLPEEKKRTKLSSMKLKERFREKYVGYGPIFTPLSEDNVEVVDEGPSVAVSTRVPGVKEPRWAPSVHLPVEEFDFVIAIACEGWPLCAQEWVTRPRCWPGKNVVQEIIQGGFHIVCKSSAEGDFRLSYSNAETLLIQSLSDLQHKVYRALKSFVNRYKNEWSPNVKKIMCSYHVKTIMLWYCEKCDTSDWSESTIVEHLLSLIDQLIKALRERSLPMYFMPKHNLMERIEDGTAVAEEVSKARFNLNLVTDAILSEEPDFGEWCKFLLKILPPELYKPFQNGIENGNFQSNDFYEWFQKMFDGVDEYWMNTVGRIPTRNNEEGEKAMKILQQPIALFVDKMCENFNNFGMNEQLEFLEGNWNENQ